MIHFIMYAFATVVGIYVLSYGHTFGSNLVNGIRQPDGTLMALSPRQVADQMYYVKKDTTRLQGITDGFNF